MCGTSAEVALCLPVFGTQMLIAHGDCTNTTRESALNADSRRKRFLAGIKPVNPKPATSDRSTTHSRQQAIEAPCTLPTTSDRSTTHSRKQAIEAPCTLPATSDLSTQSLTSTHTRQQVIEAHEGLLQHKPGNKRSTHTNPYCHPLPATSDRSTQSLTSTHSRQQPIGAHKAL